MKVRRNIKQYGNNNIQDKDPVGSVFHHSKEEGGSSGGEERMQKTEITDKSQRMSCVTYFIYYSSVATLHTLCGGKNNGNFHMSGGNTDSQ